MGHGLGSDIGSDLSSAPPSPRLDPSSPPRLPPSLPPPSPPQPGTRERSPSSATAPWKTRPRTKRQPSTTVPNPPSSPKRRKRAEIVKEKDTSEGGKKTGKGKEVDAIRGKGGAKAVGKVKVQVKDPSPPTAEPSDEKASTSKVVSPAPWKKTAKAKVSPPPTPVPAPAPFAKAKPAITSNPLFNTSKSASSDPPRPAPSTTKSIPSSSKPVPTSAKSTRTTKRPVYNESADSTDEEEEEKPKRHKRRKSHIEATPKPVRKPRPSLPAQPTPKAKAKAKLEPPGPLELRPASFLSKTNSFLTRPIVPSATLNLQPREDVWSYDDLTGLTWVKLGIHKCEIVPGNEQAVSLGEQWCWWPAEVKQNTTNGLILVFCGLGIERELTPSAAGETNVLTFRKPNSSTVRFPTFKTAFSPTVEVGSPPASSGEAPNQPAGEPSTAESSILPIAESSTTPILSSSPLVLETRWKQALSRAFEIDTESNDGLVDIHLLFSQKSQTPRDEDELSGNTVLEEQDDDEQDEDLLENGTSVLCRYRTRYYPAKIVSYHPREGKAKHRPGHKARYKCVFADDSTRLATRLEIMTTLDDGFAICPLGTYRHYTSHTYEKPSGVREPSPTPRADSPAPEPEDVKIDPEEYCSRERMRDQLKPVLPFLKGLIERTYIPGRGVVEESLSKPETETEDKPSTNETNLPPDNSSTKEPDTKAPNDSSTENPNPPEPVLDRHAIFMQGGRARKNLAYSVYTGDLNEDDCEELMFEISRWALRGERWACGEGASLEGGESMDQESGEGEGTSQQVKEGGESQKESEVREAVEDTSSLQQTQEDERIVEETKAPSNTEDVEMQDATQETSETSTPATEQDPQSETKSGDSTELEDDPLTVVRNLEQTTPLTPSTRGDFRSLVKLQPPRPVGAPDYEGLTPEERMGYVSDVLYPEAAALILSYRRGIRTQPGPLVDPAAERALHTAGLQAAKNTCSTFDWVEQILAVRQLRESNSKYQVEEQTQVVVAGGTKSRPKFMTSVFK